MTREITISVPDEVADWFKRDPKASARLCEEARRRMAEFAKPSGKTAREALAEVGFIYTDEELEEARREMDEAAAMMTPELREFAGQLLATPPHLLGSNPPADV